jgi:hypothetical protein
MTAPVGNSGITMQCERLPRFLVGGPEFEVSGVFSGDDDMFEGVNAGLTSDPDDLRAAAAVIDKSTAGVRELDPNSVLIRAHDVGDAALAAALEAFHQRCSALLGRIIEHSDQLSARLLATAAEYQRADRDTAAALGAHCHPEQPWEPPSPRPAAGRESSASGAGAGAVRGL